MTRSRRAQSGLVATAMGALLVSPWALPSALAASALAPSSMPHIGVVDERFQSYNIEMVEVTGGHFWRPYRDNERAGADSSMFAYRKSIDLANPRLRKLAAALGPAYLRVSGTWANTTYSDDTGNLTSPPSGFGGVLTHSQWQGVIDFARAVDAKLVTSFATGAGTRNSRSVWTPREARKFVAYTRALGGQIAAAEFMNEPDLAPNGGGPSGYDAASYARDIEEFRTFLRKNRQRRSF